MNTRHMRSSWPTLALAAILLWAALLRLWNLDATEFKFDEARVATLAARFVDTGSLPATGMGASTGIDNPPGAIYLFSLPVLLSRDPWVLSAWVALLNVAAVWGCYRFGRAHWGTAAGLLAALLLASSPWAIFYSRKVWAQDLLLPVVLLLFALLYAWVVGGSRRGGGRWAICGALVTLSFLTQIHLAALSLVPVVGLAVALTLIQRLRTRQAASIWLPLAAGLVLAALLYVPYLAADAQQNWRNVRALVQATGAPATIQWQAVRYLLLNVGGREIHALAGPERYREFLAGILNLDYWPDRILEALVVLSALYLGIQAVRQRKQPHVLARNGLLLLWLVGPALFFLRSSTPVYPHYLIPAYPAPYLVLAVAVTHLLSPNQKPGFSKRPGFSLRSFQRWIAVLATLLLAAGIAWQAYLSLSIYAFVDQHDTPGGMGTPIRILRQVARTMVQQSAAWNNRQAVLLCPGDEPRWDECPAVYGFMLGRALDLRVADRANLLLPQSASDTLLVLAPGAESAVELLPTFVQPLPAFDVPLRENVAEYRFYRLPAGQAPTPETGVPARLANGVEFLGAGFTEPPQPGQATRLLLYWRVLEVPPDPPPQGYSLGNHLLTANGERIAQADGPGHRVGLWRSGDTLISAFDLALPADAPPPPYLLRTGMYVYTPPDQFATIPVIDAQGLPVADAAEWPVP